MLGATSDGCSINRRLIKVHNPKEEIVYKTKNPFSQDQRDLYFFADSPHLIKTVRNCWNSTCRSMWVCMIVWHYHSISYIFCETEQWEKYFVEPSGGIVS